MKIISANVTNVVSNFLHAGYGSKSSIPERFSIRHYPNKSPDLELEVAESLRLQGENLLGNVGPVDGQPLTNEMVSPLFSTSMEWTTALLACVTVFALIGIYYLMRDWVRIGSPRLVSALTVVCVAMGVFFITTTNFSTATADDEVPQQDGLQKYVHPRDATLVIMHGILADPLINNENKIKSLSKLRKSVALPVADLTEGESYALKNFTREGWGNEFKLMRKKIKRKVEVEVDRHKRDRKTRVRWKNRPKKLTKYRYTVISAGEDGEFNTPDDLTMVVKQTTNLRWPRERWAFFVTEKENKKMVLLYYRWPGDEFRARNPKDSRKLTGGKKFDLLAISKLPEFETSYSDLKETLQYRPLVLQLFHLKD